MSPSAIHVYKLYMFKRGDMPKRAHVDLDLPEWVIDSGDNHVMIRINDDHGIDQYVKELIDKYCDIPMPYLVVKEEGKDGENPHYHLCFATSTTMPTLRQALRRRLTGNEAYSLKQCKELPKQFLYLCKGEGTGEDDKPNIVHKSEHFTDERIEELHAMYWRNNDAITSSQKKSKLAENAGRDILMMCQQRGYTDQNKAEIFDICIAYYRKRAKYLRPTYLRDLVCQTAVYLSPGGPAELDLKVFCISSNLN